MSQRPPILAARSLFLASCTVLVLHGCGGESAEGFTNSGKVYLGKGDYAAAVIQFKSALQKTPENAEARYLLGTALREMGDPTGAAIELRKAASAGYEAMDLYPQLLRALLESGKFDEVLLEGEGTNIEDKRARSAILSLMSEALLYSGKADAAQKKLQDALSLDPANQRAKLILSKLALFRGELAEANRIVDELLAKTEAGDAVYFQKGVLVQATGNFPEAVRLYKRAIELRPTSSQAYSNVILLLLEQGDVQAASDYVTAMQKAAGRSPVALYLEALVAYSKGDKSRARDVVREVLRIAMDYASANALAGAIALDAGNYGEAEQYLLKALSVQSGALNARRLLVTTYARSGQIDKAKAAIGPLLKEGSQDKGTLLLAGEVYAASGEVRKAVGFFEKASSLDPKNSAAYTRLGQMYLLAGDPQRAIQNLGTASALDLTHTEADVVLVSYYLSRKQFANALQAAEGLKKKQPDNPITHNLLGLVRLAKSDKVAARVDFERALELQPSFLPAARNLAALDIQEGKPEVAVKRFEAVTASDPKQSEAWLALVGLKQQAGAPSPEVLPLLDQAISANPASTRAKLAKIAYLLKSGDARKAVGAALDAQAAHPSDAAILDALAGAQLKAGETDQAITNYGKLTALLPKSAAPYLGLAGAHAAQKEWTAARNALRRATEIQPEWLPAREAQVLLGVASQQYEDALAAAKLIQKEWPKLPTGYVAEADIFAVQKHWAEAESTLKDAIRHLDNAALAGKLYSVLEKQGKTEADAMAMSWSSRHPTDPTLAAAIGQGYLGRQDFQNAARWYRLATKAQPKNAVLLNNLAWSLGQLKDPTAVEIGKQALAIAPRSTAIMDTLAMLYVENGEPAKGAELLGQAVARSPRSGTIRLNYAKTLIAAGKKADARKELELIPTLHTNQAVKDEALKLLASL